MASAYRLEISSPGIDRPLVRVRFPSRCRPGGARRAEPSARKRPQAISRVVNAVEGEGKDALLTLARNDAAPTKKSAALSLAISTRPSWC